MEKVIGKIIKLNVMFDTHLDDADSIVFDCVCGLVYEVENLSCCSITLRKKTVDEVSARQYVKDCMFSLYSVFPDISTEVSMTNCFTKEYFADVNTLY